MTNLPRFICLELIWYEFVHVTCGRHFFPMPSSHTVYSHFLITNEGEYNHCRPTNDTSSS